ncbi:MAG: MBL fold metallo-hydrolase [Candidatus Diapherotrites archaeon]|nr:MBL fold metallo-hydrolase [Candidatus Diapherotrites archaeon]
MELVVLGSGTCVPNLNRSESAYVINAGKHQLLFDCGAGTKRRLADAKIDYRKIDYIFLSHSHNDHINDLPAIIWSYSYFGSPRSRKLNFIGPRGLKEYFRLLLKMLKFKDIVPKINVMEVKNNTIKIDGISIKSAPVPHLHAQNCVAYRIEHKGKAIVYSGDTGYTDKLIKLAKDADLLVLECSNPDELKYSGHLIPKECGEIATRANAKALMLTHFYPEADKPSTRAQARKKYKGKIIIAKDLMRVKI